MEVEIVARELLKPSSPTSSLLRNFRISFLDQMAPAVYIPVVLFYPCPKLEHLGHPTKNVPRVSQHLKTSLSETLSRFYPFAGKIKDHVSIECNDNGAHFVEAQCHCHLFEILQKPNADMLQKFLPVEMESIIGSLLQVQVTFFGCGWMAIRICISHILTDASTINLFIKNWTTTARHDDN